MSYLFFRLGVLATLVFVLACTAARQIGTVESSDPLFDGFQMGCENQPHPCWYGIVPDVTTFEAANVLLRQYGLDFGHDLYQSRHLVTEYCNVFFVPDGAVIANLTFVDCKGIRAGDLMRQFGMPDAVLICHDVGAPKPYYSYRAGLNIRTDNAPPGSYWATPYDHVSGFEMFVTRRVYPAGFEFPNPWRGFLPPWKYIRFSPIYDQYCYGEG